MKNILWNKNLKLAKWKLKTGWNSPKKAIFCHYLKNFVTKLQLKNENENEKGNFQKAKHILNLKSWKNEKVFWKLMKLVGNLMCLTATYCTATIQMLCFQILVYLWLFACNSLKSAMIWLVPFVDIFTKMLHTTAGHLNVSLIKQAVIYIIFLCGSWNTNDNRAYLQDITAQPCYIFGVSTWSFFVMKHLINIK